jgi:hypothetical protein
VSHARRGHDAGAIEPRSAPPTRRHHTTFGRFVGAVGLVLLTSLLYWMLTDESFRVTDASVSFERMAHADEAEVRTHLTDIDRGPNVFRVRASDIVSELSTLPEVDAAYARVVLPASVSVELDERDPVFIWSNGAVSWLVDEEGMLFAPADSDRVLEPNGAAREALSTVEDGRSPPEPPTVGSFLPASDLAVMRQLLAVTPELLGSQAENLTLRVDERDGYVLKSDRGWTALFGHYTPTLQPPEVIPRQVQCLQWLLGSEERKLETVRLALSDEACGTFTKHG